MTIITHKNLRYWLGKLADHPDMQCGARTHDPDAWFRANCTLEFPLGEIARDSLTTLALLGRERPDPAPLTGKEGFNAQGHEGKIAIDKPLIGALLNMRDLLPEYRGRILVA